MRRMLCARRHVGCYRFTSLCGLIVYTKVHLTKKRAKWRVCSFLFLFCAVLLFLTWSAGTSTIFPVTYPKRAFRGTCQEHHVVTFPVLQMFFHSYKTCVWCFLTLDLSCSKRESPPCKEDRVLHFLLFLTFFGLSMRSTLSLQRGRLRILLWCLCPSLADRTRDETSRWSKLQKHRTFQLSFSTLVYSERLFCVFYFRVVSFLFLFLVLVNGLVRWRSCISWMTCYKLLLFRAVHHLRLLVMNGTWWLFPTRTVFCILGSQIACGARIDLRTLDKVVHARLELTWIATSTITGWKVEPQQTHAVKCMLAQELRQRLRLWRCRTTWYRLHHEHFVSVMSIGERKGGGWWLGKITVFIFIFFLFS